MAAVALTVSGILYDKYGRTARPVTLVGEASLTGLGVGGGPILPPEGGGSGEHPSHPSAMPGDPWWGQDLHPAHPIELPKPPTEPPTGQPDEDGFLKPPPAEGGWAFHEDYGWLLKPKGAGPK